MGSSDTPLRIMTLDQDRAERCLAEVQRTLQKFNCQILPQIMFVGSQVAQSGFVIAPTPAVPPDLSGDKGNR